MAKNKEEKKKKRAALAGGVAALATKAPLEAALTIPPALLAKRMASGKPFRVSQPLATMLDFSPAERKAFAEMAAESGVSIKGMPGWDNNYYIDPDSPSNRLGRKFLKPSELRDLPSNPTVVISRSSKPILLHELGHAKPVLGSHRARRFLQESSRGLGYGPSRLARYGLIGNILAGRPEESGAKQFAYDNAPALMVATKAPLLLEEARASANAIIAARRKGMGALRTLKELAPAYGNYVGYAAAPAIVALIAKRVVESIRGESKTASVAGAEVKAPGSLRTPASAAWRVGGKTPPKPKSIKPGEGLNVKAKTRMPSKPPSNRHYHRDMLKSLYSPQRGYRLTVRG